MKMLSILLAATFAGYLLYGDSQFLGNRLGKVTCQIIFIDLAIETVQTAGGGHLRIIHDYLSFLDFIGINQQYISHIQFSN